MLKCGQLMMYYCNLYEFDILLFVLGQTLKIILDTIRKCLRNKSIAFAPCIIFILYKFMLTSLRMYNSFLLVSSLATFLFRVCRKLLLFGGREIIPTVIGLVYWSKISKNMFWKFSGKKPFSKWPRFFLTQQATTPPFLFLSQRSIW